MKRFLNPADDELKVLPLRVCDGSPYPLSRANIDKLISLSHIEEYSNGELIMKAGEIFTCLAIVISALRGFGTTKVIGKRLSISVWKALSVCRCTVICTIFRPQKTAKPVGR